MIQTESGLFLRFSPMSKSRKTTMYFVIKWAVRNAIIEAEEELYKRKYGKELPESEDEEETE